MQQENELESTVGQAEALGVGKVEKRNTSPSTTCQQEAVYSVPLLLALGFCLMQRHGTRQQGPKQDKNHTFCRLRRGWQHCHIQPCFSLLPGLLWAVRA